jgi:hypothetical protein
MLEFIAPPNILFLLKIVNFMTFSCKCTTMVTIQDVILFKYFINFIFSEIKPKNVFHINLQLPTPLQTSKSNNKN